MNEPQVWVLIGVFTTIMLGGMTLMTTLINRATAEAINGVRDEIGGLRGEIGGEIGGLRGEMNARFEAVHVRFDSLEKRDDQLDGDVAALTRHLWGRPEAG
ncbi:hypothetical protein [Microbacterium sp.]|uniref:hypothetical protein n=1 Tax=Microbacterium sp. TaxID=51671 RepID=UPI003C27E680